MRLLALAGLMALLCLACATDPDITVAASSPATTPAPEKESQEAPAGATEVDLSALLLTAEDVPGWRHSGPMDFDAEPTFVADDCDLMNQAWAANSYPGTRTRANIAGAALRHTVVELEDEAAAAAVLDAADRVWEECTEFTLQARPWWAEPIGVPPAGWRSSGLVIGDAYGLTWVIAYWQQDTVVVLLEVDGERTFDYLQPLLTAAAGRLSGTPAPVPDLGPPGIDPAATTAPDRTPASEPTPEPKLTSEPEPSPEPEPTLFPAPLEPGEEQAWLDHPLAKYVPEASELGETWSLNSTVVTEYGEAQDTEDLEACGLTAPPTLEGIEVSYTVERQYESAVTFVVNRGTAAETQSYLDVFRALPACDLEVLGFYDGFIEITTETITVDRADDALIMRIESNAEEANLSAVYVAVRRGDLLFAMTSGNFGVEGPVNQLSADQMLAIIGRAADRS